MQDVSTGKTGIQNTGKALEELEEKRGGLRRLTQSFKFLPKKFHHQKQFSRTRPMSSYATPRQCSMCLNDSKPGYQVNKAEYWKYTTDINGAINESSRIPVCEAHAA